ncbi:SDR family oxidoreductase [Lolliginicoccus levis]|uniref:SDR family oxidoreductase n=1 Tax=Lolliginicoccus levis TaxID=2919542 RepID=UPI00241E237F|nr:SDR family oxidoreductase [Lolliginicoccus levis]
MSATARVAIITGAARGIGAATAEALHAAGMHVLIADVLDDEARQLVAQLGDRADQVHLDVRDEQQWRDAASLAASRGQLAALVNNAGILRFGAIEEQSVEDFRLVLDVNLIGAWLGIRACAAQLRASKGVIVNISSTAGLAGYSGIGAYVASKWALRGLTKTAALELAGSGVRACSIHPGPIRTPMTAGFDDTMVADQPIPRFGEPREVADMVDFLIHRATYSTGTEFVVDGGALTGTMLAPPE